MQLPSIQRRLTPRFDPVQITMIAVGVLIIFVVAAVL
jgi:hypothetical protein